MTPRSTDRSAGSEKVAEVLASHPPELGELAKARGEKRLLEGLRGEALGGEALRGRSAPARTSSRAPWLAAGAIGLAAAAALALFFARTDHPEGVSAPVARFTVRDVEATSQQGTLDEGSTLTTGEHEVADLRVTHSQIRIEPQSHLRIASLGAERVDLELSEGEVRVEFHPEQRGREHLSVATPHARVEVVGTVFTVRATATGTEVSVSEGVVRVVPRDGSAPRRVRAGEVTRVDEAPADAEPNGAEPNGAEPRTAAASDGESDDTSGEVANAASHDGSGQPTAGSSEHPSEGPIDGVATPGAGAPGPIAGGSGVEPVEPARPPSPAEQLAQARRFLELARPDQAEPLLRAITTGTGRGRVRAEAWTLLADIAQRASRLEDAAADYEHAATEGHGTIIGHNAVYALARLQERRLGDPAAARASYARYLEEAPSGPLADQVTQALCRLGDETRCGAPR